MLRFNHTEYFVNESKNRFDGVLGIWKCVEFRIDFNGLGHRNGEYKRLFMDKSIGNQYGHGFFYAHQFDLDLIFQSNERKKHPFEMSNGATGQETDRFCNSTDGVCIVFFSLFRIGKSIFGHKIRNHDTARFMAWGRAITDYASETRERNRK